MVRQNADGATATESFARVPLVTWRNIPDGKIELAGASFFELELVVSGHFSDVARKPPAPSQRVFRAQRFRYDGARFVPG